MIDFQEVASEREIYYEHRRLLTIIVEHETNVVRQTDRQTDGRTDGRMDRQTDRQTD